MQYSIPETGFLRIKDVLRFIPVSKSTWWAGVKSGKFPQPVHITPRVTAWRAECIQEYIEKLNTKSV